MTVRFTAGGFETSQGCRVTLTFREAASRCRAVYREFSHYLGLMVAENSLITY